MKKQSDSASNKYEYFSLTLNLIRFVSLKDLHNFGYCKREKNIRKLSFIETKEI